MRACASWDLAAGRRAMIKTYVQLHLWVTKDDFGLVQLRPASPTTFRKTFVNRISSYPAICRLPSLNGSWDLMHKANNCLPARESVQAKNFEGAEQGYVVQAWA